MNKSGTLEEEAERPLKGASRPAPTPSSDDDGRQGLADIRLPGVLVGRFVALRNSKEPLVDFPSNTSGELVLARSLVPVTEGETDREVVLVFEDGDPARPIIVGLLQTAGTQAANSSSVKLDDETLVFSAKKEVVIQCGKASITLTSAGKVLIRGAYVLSRSSGVNRIKGGSVQIN